MGRFKSLRQIRELPRQVEKIEQKVREEERERKRKAFFAEPGIAQLFNELEMRRKREAPPVKPIEKRRFEIQDVIFTPERKRRRR